MNVALIFALATYFLAQSGGHPTFKDDVDPSDEAEYDPIQAESDRRGNKMSQTIFSIEYSLNIKSKFYNFSKYFEWYNHKKGLSGCKWYGSAPFKCYSRKSFRGTGCPSGTYWIKDDSYGETRKSNGALVKGNYCWFGRVKKYCCNNSKLISLYKIILPPGILKFQGLFKLSRLIMYVLSDWNEINLPIQTSKRHNVLEDNLINSAIGNSYY